MRRQPRPPLFIVADDHCCDNHYRDLFDDWFNDEAAGSSLCVKLDAFHWLSRFNKGLTCNHPLARFFWVDLKNAIFTSDEGDVLRLKQVSE